LSNGTFSISLATAAGAGRHVQYGFETTGVNVWATDVGPFGSLRIGPAAASPFAAWISGFDFAAFANPDLTAAGDPDGDGQSNLKEFALNGDPRSGADSAKLRSRIEDVAGGKALVLTLPVRGNPDFAGNPAKSATADQVTYHIEGSNGLGFFDQGVTEIPASGAGLPVLDSGWRYRAFRLDGWVAGSPSRGPAGFLRVRLEDTP
jgi:hypothetical protein